MRIETTTKTKIAILLLTGLALLAGGCGQKQQTGEAAPEQDRIPLTCIGVMPVVTETPDNGQPDFKQSKALARGAEVLTQLVQERYGGREDIRFLSAAQLSGLQAGDASPLARIRQAGEFTSCNGVLTLAISRYHDRIGGPYSAADPASVAFSYRLIEANSGQVLCQGEFDETQQSVLENLFSLESARERGFTWITAQELLREGLTDKFQDCPYLKIEE